MATRSSSSNMIGFLIPANEDTLPREITVGNSNSNGLEGDENELRQGQIGELLGGIDFSEDGRQVLLMRSTAYQPGLMAYYQDDSCGKRQNNLEMNKRATCFAMTCGLLNARFVGPVILLTVMPICRGIKTIKPPVESVEQLLAACKTPDIRSEILLQIAGSATPDVSPAIADAVSSNYHDHLVLKKFQDVMRSRSMSDDESGDFVSFLDSEDGHFDLNDEDDDEEDGNVGHVASRSSEVDGVEFAVTRVPLCLHCRRPASTLCTKCQGAYFCDAPRKCREDGWSHDCLCPTWNLYVQRRNILASFPLGSWTQEIVTRQCELSDEPYEQYLNNLGIQRNDKSWWRAEFGGWSGGSSDSAQSVDLDERYNYAQGFAPIADIPPEEDIPMDALKAKNWDDELGLRRLSDWGEYYDLRGIPLSSPAALLLTFPLTLYHAIVEYGRGPCQVARMMERPLRIDIVGAEKELIFLPLFQEVAFLLPDDLRLELVFVVRPDMLPESMKMKESREQTFSFDKLMITIQSGIYGDSLDPLFDLGRSGPPDMVMAFNAGLYAYESWRSVVELLKRNKNSIGVFTDYNEWSGVQCASLGGGESRKSLTVNPFRQPRAMPVYSMNLPQFSNGFLYVFNQQSNDQ